LNERNLTMAAVSGTFNMIHPNPRKRRDGLRRLGVLAGACGQLGTSVITLCTGTRDPEDMWRSHPENDVPEAWHACSRPWSGRSKLQKSTRSRLRSSRR
jgi:sugar phosphate isomerase/epimerase